MDAPKRMALIASKGALDMAYPPLILASTAAALDYEVQVFFTFYGLTLLRKDLSDVRISPLANPAMPMPLPMPVLVSALPGMEIDGDDDDEAEVEKARRRFARGAAVGLPRSRREADRLPDDARPLRIRSAANSSTASSTAARRRSWSSPARPTSRCSSDRNRSRCRAHAHLPGRRRGARRRKQTPRPPRTSPRWFALYHAARARLAARCIWSAPARATPSSSRCVR